MSEKEPKFMVDLEQNFEWTVSIDWTPPDEGIIIIGIDEVQMNE